MSETRFRIVVDVDPTQAKPEIKGLEKSLEGVEAAAKKASAAMAARIDEVIKQEDKAAAAARAASVARIDETIRQADAYDAIINQIKSATNALRLSDDELKRQNITQQAMNSAKAQGIDISNEQIAKLNDEISAHINAANAIKAERAAAKDLADEIKRQAAAEVERTNAAKAATEEATRQAGAYAVMLQNLAGSTAALRMNENELLRHNMTQQALNAAKSQGITLSDGQRAAIDREISAHVNMVNAIKSEQAAIRASSEEFDRRKALLVSIVGDSAGQKQKLEDLQHLYETGAISASKLVDAKMRIEGTSAQGASAFKDGIAGVGSEAVKSTSAINTMLQMAGVGAAIAKVQSYISAYADINERIGAVSESSDELASRLNDVFKVAQDSYTGFAKTADNIARLSNATGGATDAATELASTLQKAAQLGGTSGESQKAGIDALIDGIEKGQLGALGLKTVMEKTPEVAKLLAESLGKTREELPKLANAGKLTADALVKSLGSSADSINDKFKDAAPSIENGLTLINNAATKFFGDVATGSGALSTIGAALAFVGDNFETIGRVAVAAGEVLAVIFVGKGINAAIAGIRALGIAATANPLGALLLGLGSAIALFTQFADKIDAGVDGTIKMSDVLSVLWGDIKKLGSAIYELLQGAWGGLTAAFETGIPTDGIEMSMKNAAIFVASFVDVAIGLFKSMRDNTLPIFGGMAVSIGEFFVTIAQDIAHVFEAMINKIISAINKVTSIAASVADAVLSSPLDDIDFEQSNKAGKLVKRKKAGHDFSIGKVDFGFDNPLEGAGSSMLDLIKKAGRDVTSENSGKDYVASVFDRASSSTGTKFSGGGKRATVSGSRDGTSDSEIKDQIDLNLELAQILVDRDKVESLAAQNRIKLLSEYDAAVAASVSAAETKNMNAELDAAAKSLVELQKELNAESQRYAEIVDDIRGPMEDYKQTLADVTALEASGAITTKEYTDFVNKLNAEFAKSQPVNEWADTIEKSVKPAIMDALTQMSDAFLEFARTGKGSFSGMVDSILQNLERLLLNKALEKLVNLMLGGLGGGSSPADIAAGSAGSAVADAIGGIGDGLFRRRGGADTIGGARGNGVSTGGGSQQPALASERRGGGNAPIIRLYNITDPNAPINAIASSGGEQAVMRVMAKNANTVRNLTRR